MGLNAYVTCNCYKDGKAAPLPVPPDLVKQDEDGFMYLALPYEGNESLHEAFDGWWAAGCPHFLREQAEVWVGTWAGVHSFQKALTEVGREHVPTLLDIIPDCNGGQVSPEQAALALREVEYLTASSDFGRRIVLVDADTGDVVLWGAPGKETTRFAQCDGELVLSESGIVLSRPRRLFLRPRVFAARRFTQRMLPRWGLVELRNPDTGEFVLVRTPLSVYDQDEANKAVVRHPRNLQVGWRNAYTGTLEALATIFRASLEIGNPVIWT